MMPSFGWIGKTALSLISVVGIAVAFFYKYLMCRVCRNIGTQFNVMIHVDVWERMIGVLMVEIKMATLTWGIPLVDTFGHYGCRLFVKT